eukprot:m.48767 g.48767  ORF g.48767 m.48767 type:complete len:406 (-) comp10584_c0_seq2:87-1304(-)
MAQQGSNSTDNQQGAVKAGRLAEDKLLAAFRKVAGINGAYVFKSLRIPIWQDQENRKYVSESNRTGYEFVTTPDEDSRLFKRGEIDLAVVTTRGLLVLEVKNWSGSLSISTQGDTNQSWRQTRTSGEIIDHGDVLARISEKALSLAEHMRRHGVHVLDSMVHSKVLLVNDRIRVDIDGRGIQENSDIIFPRFVEEFVESFERGILQQIADELLPKWVSGCELVPDIMRQAAYFIESTVGTWDIIHFINGEMKEGDFIGFCNAKGDLIQNTETKKMNRKKTSMLSVCPFQHSTDWISWVSQGFAEKRAQSGQDDRVQVFSHERESSSPSSFFPLVASLGGGTPGNVDSFQPNQGTVVEYAKEFLYQHKKKFLLLENCCVLKFHPVGSLSPILIPITNVSWISLSRI